MSDYIGARPIAQPVVLILGSIIEDWMKAPSYF